RTLDTRTPRGCLGSKSRPGPAPPFRRPPDRLATQTHLIPPAPSRSRFEATASERRLRRRNRSLGGGSEGGRSPPPSHLCHIEAAVDVDELAGDPASLGGGEEDRDAGDLLGLGDAPEGNLTRPLLDLRLGVAVARLRGVGEARSNGVDTNAVGRQGQ